MFERDLGKALEAVQRGKFGEAERILKNVLRRDPQEFDATQLLGHLYRVWGKLDAAEKQLRAAVALDPTFAPAHRNLGLCLAAMGRQEEAIGAFSTALTLRPNYIDAMYERAVSRKALGRTEEVVADARAILALDPRCAAALNVLAQIDFEAGRLGEALQLFERAIEADSNFTHSHFNRSLTLFRLGRNLEALGSAEAAVMLDPAFVAAQMHRAKLLGLTGRAPEAVEAARAAVEHAPENAEAQQALGEAYLAASRGKEATDVLRKAASLDPTRGDLWRSLGHARVLLGDFEGARGYMAKAVAAKSAELGEDPQQTAPLVELFNFDFQRGLFEREEQIDEARASMMAALDALTDYLSRVGERSAGLQRLFDWAAFSVNGFYQAYHQRNDVAMMTQFSAVLASLVRADEKPFTPRARDGRIRLGVASAFLRNHNGANWAYEWIAHLPPEFDIFTYSLAPQQDDTTKKFASLGRHRQLNFDADTFRSTLEVMRGDQLDLMFLPEVGMAPGDRILSLHRVARRQFTAWGHPCTTGSAQMDFYLSSDLMEAANAQEHYSEKLVRVPNIGLYLPAARETARPPSSVTLPRGRVKFGCLQSLYKYVPRYDVVFPRVAAELPEALFVFIEGNPPYMTEIMRVRLRRAFREMGLDMERHVAFVPRQTGEGYEALMREMDVNVDSIGWSGGNTSLQSFFNGVPLVTLAGEFMRGRHSSAMYEMMGYSELVAPDLDSFCAKLVELGRDPEARARASQEIRARSGALRQDKSLLAGLESIFRGFAES